MMQDLVVEALSLCIEGSRAAEQLPEPRRRQVLDHYVRQLLAQGSLDLNALWGGLLREPGVTERNLGSVFVAIEEARDVLGVPMAPVQRLQALTPAQRQQLRAECAVERAHLAELARRYQGGAPAPTLDTEAEKAARARAARALLDQANGTAPAPESTPAARPTAMPSRDRPKPAATAAPSRAPVDPARERKKRAIAAVAMTAAVISCFMAFGLNAKPSRFDLSGLALELSDGLREKDAVQGVITDKRWAQMDDAARQAAAREVFDKLRARGIREVGMRDQATGRGFVISDRSGTVSVLVDPVAGPPPPGMGAVGGAPAAGGRAPSGPAGAPASGGPAAAPATPGQPSTAVP